MFKWREKKRTENAQQFCAMFPLCVCVCVCKSVLHACLTGSWLHAPPTCRSVGCWVGRLNALMVGWMLRWLVRWLISTTPKGTQRAKEERKKNGRKGRRQKRNNNKTAAAVNVDARASLCDIAVVVVAVALVAVVVVVLHL